MNTPLINAIKENAKVRKHRFCMPGHKGRIRAGKLYASAFFDITELDYSDNLLYPSGVILESERLTAQNYGVRRSFYLTQGTTTGNIICARVIKGLGIDDVLMERSSHNSVYNAIGLAGLTPHFIENRIEDGVPRPLTLEQVKKAYKDGIKAIFFTSPNYFGAVAEVEEICEFARKVGMITVCDSAHGAHFAYSDLLPSGAESFADLTSASAHKTLPCYTGGAYLHVREEELVSRVERELRAVHSSSPSYLITCSLDYAQAVMREKGSMLYARLKKKIDKLKKKSRIEIEKNDDFTRISLVSRSGEVLKQRLGELGIECEFSYGKRCVLIASPFDIRSIKRLMRALSKLNVDPPLAESVSLPHLEQRVDYLTAFQSDVELVSLDGAVGRVSGALVGLYPPAIPVLCYGEEITESAVEFVNKYQSSAYGLAKDKLIVLK